MISAPFFLCFKRKKEKSQLAVQGDFILCPYTLLVELANLSQGDSDNRPTNGLGIDLPVQPIKLCHSGNVQEEAMVNEDR